ncbi:MAG: bifunctional metallophosphatase/5'-nucleotidase [Candidatus Viridilinea halotolerans]|uniref:Bifunctional metallophosphatase/5'-nucleotidase n=1 Tax=Candidatus Viridilinea halotolerans TaxID=2491704 RepID=A0A426U789_9CHLR|nr:MAG: bifunctional metallophosphatase/5'-nucleotidase [Candidatus Viridilinea halotolerans]
MRKPFALLLVLLLFIAAYAAPVAAQDTTTVTLFHFSDYHSHALPFYSEGRPDQGGVARAVGYLRQFAADPNTLIFNGGDMMNLDVPTWGVKYTCIEWPWFNGIVDAMAFGNHDADYGADHFAQCRSQIDYPLLGANVLDAAGNPLFLHNDKNYMVFTMGEVKVGVFAVVGPDFERLVPPARRPLADATFGDSVAAARAVVRTLREDEGVNAVISIGHGHFEDDMRLAQQVPGIDLIFGTHSHLKRELELFPGTNTYSISPYQYLTYISRVQLSFREGVLVNVSGALLPVDATMPADPDVAARVAQLQAELEADPTYAPMFAQIGTAATELSESGKLTGETTLGNWVTDIARAATGSHLALITSSGFREAIPPGPIIEETLRTSMPFANKLLVFPMNGALVEEVLNYSVSRRGFDFFSQVSGVRFNIVEGRASNIQVLADPANPAAGYVPLDLNATYQVATTDFQGLIAAGYSEIFARAGSHTATGIDLRDQVRAHIQANSPVSAQLDGRISDGSPAAIPASLPRTAASPAPAFAALLLLALVSSLVGLAMRIRRA